MKKALLAGFSLLFFGLQGQNQSPSGLLQFELLLQEELVPYQNLITIDLSATPADTVSYLEVSTQNSLFTSGLEIADGDSLPWIISNKSNHQQVDIINSMADTLIREKIYTNAQNQDTLIEVFGDTAGTGTLSPVQDVRISYDSLGVDTLFTFLQSGQLAGATVNLGASRDSLGRLDTVATKLEFMGTRLPVQLLTYHYDSVSGRIDSVLVQDPNTGYTVTGKFIPTYGAHGYIEVFTLFEVDNFGEFLPVLRYEFTPISDLSRQSVSPPKFSFFPNPATDYLTVEGLFQGEVTLYTLSGKKRWSASLSETRQRFDLSELPRGTYLISIKDEAGVRHTEKLHLQ